ncbi:MAG: rhomboid family intramembrane serine protease [Armatimonadota bacterium]|nr:rhomboid family intramembrane serine protease [Armatimonadota bacterium]
MIPLRDENPTRTTPVVVIVLIVLNVLVFLIDQLGATDRMGALAGFAMIPKEILTGQDIRTPSPHPLWITIFTSMFMHGGLLHLGGNMLYLWIFGNNIEDVLGHFKFLLFYLAGGVAAAFAHIVTASVDPTAATIPTVGASGAIAAVLGAYLVLYPTARIICLVFLGWFITTAAIPALVVLALWFLLQLLNVSIVGGAGGGVAYWAHIGGFVIGIILIYVLGGKNLSRRGRRPRDYYRRYGF